MARWRCVFAGDEGWEALCARVEAALPAPVSRQASARAWTAGAWPFASRHARREVTWEAPGIFVRATATLEANDGAMTEAREVAVEAEGDEARVALLSAALRDDAR